MFKPLSYRRLLSNVFDLSSLGQALEDVVIPQIGRLAVAAFKAFDLSSLSTALDEDIAAQGARLSVAVSDAFDLSPLSQALEDVIASSPVLPISDPFDLSPLSRALEDVIAAQPARPVLPISDPFDLSPLSRALEDVIAAQPPRPVLPISDPFDLSSLSRALDESVAAAAQVHVKHQLPNSKNHSYLTKTVTAIRGSVNTAHDDITAIVTPSTVSARKTEKSRAVGVPAEVVDIKPVPVNKVAKSAAAAKPPRIDAANLASSSKVVVEEFQWRTGILRCSSTFSKSSKRPTILGTTNQPNVSHTPSGNAKDKSTLSKKPSIEKPFRTIAYSSPSSSKVLASAGVNVGTQTTPIVSKKRKHDIVEMSSDFVRSKKHKCDSAESVISPPSRKRKLSDALESFETGPTMKRNRELVTESPASRAVNQCNESKQISVSAQIKALPLLDRCSESKQISVSAQIKVPPPLNQCKQISGSSHTKALPTKKRTHDDAFESPKVFVTKDPRKRRREADARPSNAATPTLDRCQYDMRPSVTFSPQVIPPPATEGRRNEEMTSRKCKHRDEPFEARCDSEDDLVSYEEFEAQADSSTDNQLNKDDCRTTMSLPRNRKRRTVEVFGEGQVENIVDVDNFIAECCGVVVEEAQGGEVGSIAEGDDDETQEVVEECGADEEEAEADEDEHEEEARCARHLQLCREVFGDGEDSDDESVSPVSSNNVLAIS